MNGFTASLNSGMLYSIVFLIHSLISSRTVSLVDVDNYKYWDFIPNIAKEYFVKKVVIVGTESCGKSTLVHNIALYYNTNYIKEYGRTICEELGGYEDVFTDNVFPYIAST